MSRIEFEASAAVRVARAADEVWDFLNRIPAALATVPIIRGVREVVPGARYVLDFGRYGVGAHSLHVECDMAVRRDPPRRVGFETVAGTGNADVALTIDLVPVAPRATRLEAHLRISPHADVPRLVPVQPIVRAAGATVTQGLRHGLARMKRDLEETGG